MQPAFRILADRTDITALIQDRLLSLRLSDERALQNDTLEIRLDDRDSKINLPRHGAELEVLIGYHETGLVPKGLYTVDEVELAGPPQVMTIRARAANMRASWKHRKTRGWDNVTLGQMVATIAAEHGVAYRIHDTLAAVAYAHIDQTAESDLNLLTRLAAGHDAFATVKHGTVLVDLKSTGKTPGGKALELVTIESGELSSHRITRADHGKYQAVEAHWHNTATGQRVTERIGGAGEPVYAVNRTFPSQDEARRYAQGKLAAFDRGTSSGTLSVSPGNPRLAAEARLLLSGFRPGVNGEWVAVRVEHQFDGRGFSTRVDIEAPRR